jgi:hypothetical protein
MVAKKIFQNSLIQLSLMLTYTQDKQSMIIHKLHSHWAPNFRYRMRERGVCLQALITFSLL